MASLAARRKQASLSDKFDKAVATDTDSQCELFMKSFIFTLGDEWKTVVSLSKSFTAFVEASGNGNDCSCIQAAHFLQKNGKTRTGLQRKQTKGCRLSPTIKFVFWSTYCCIIKQ